MTAALVLNASDEPLGVVSDRRAVVLVLTEKADVVAATDAVWHAEQAAVVVPSVIRLRRFVRVPYRHQAPLTRRAVFLRDGGCCQYCGRRAENLDHVVPRSRGGTHTWDNVVAACHRCNTAKRDRFLEDTSLRLARRPEAPRTLSWVAYALGHVPASWAPWLAPAA